ncbi:MAG TPA: IPT/TIG domain-containing protein, partial [Planctomycetota bacterium]|nr:IPT/TIG domain-containing protein [Planctomycetota bacterium]
NRLSASYGGNSVHPAIPFGAGDGPENQRDGAGEVWILFSRAEGDRRLASNVDLRDPLPPALADRVTVVWGRAGDTAGEELIIGDFDADGSNDLAIGALTGAGDAGIGLAGRAYVIYGQSTWAREIDLQDYPGSAPEGGHEVAIFVGTRPNHILGDTLAVADLDRDGYDDLAIGVPHASPGGEIEAGAVAVAFGGPERWPPFTGITVEGEPTPIRHRLIFGEKADDLMSYSMAALDIDGDGYGDLFPNAMRGEDATSPLGKDAASVYVVSGYHVAEVELELETVSPSVIAMGSSADVIVTGDGFTSVADVRASIGEIEAEVLSIDSRGSLRLRLPPIDAAGLFDLTVETRHAQATLVDAIEIVSEVLFTRGDVREDGRFDITDAIAILEYLFVGETLTCLDAADVDDNGSIELTDPIRLLGWLFLGNAPPAPPHPAAGADPTPDELGCAR